MKKKLTPREIYIELIQILMFRNDVNAYYNLCNYASGVKDKNKQNKIWEDVRKYRKDIILPCINTNNLYKRFGKSIEKQLKASKEEVEK